MIDAASALGLLTGMNRRRVAHQPGYGAGGRRAAAGLVAPCLILLPLIPLSLIPLSLILAGQAATAQHIAYQPIPDTAIVTPHPVPSRTAIPRIAYPRLPADDRVAPDDFAYDDNVEDLLSSAEQAALTARLKLSLLSQNYRPAPAIWKIADRDTTIYLFGTVHILPPGFEWRNAAVDRIAAESHTLIVESVDDAVGGADLLGGIVPKGPALPPLATRVSPSHRAALASFTATLPPPAIAVIDTLPTWMAAVAISFVRDYRGGEIPGPGADDWFENDFRVRRRPVVEIEDGAAVMAKVDAIPEADQREMLDLALDAPLLSRAESRAAIHAWAKGEVGPRSALTVDMQSLGASPALSGPLLTDRNRAWTIDLIRRLKTKRGTMLFAAGAGHFIGQGSVIDLLGRRGVKVTRVQ
jgi:uncharacterized protein YbaP (TraB family)